MILHRLIHRLLNETKGQDMVEYALLAGFIAVAGAVAIPDLTFQLKEVYYAILYVLGIAAGGSPTPPPV